MALKKLPYRQLRVLLRRYLSTEEDAKTATLIRELRQARVRGYLKRHELEKVCRWKSARAICLIKSNSGARVRTATRRALATRSERRRLQALMTSQGSICTNGVGHFDAVTTPPLRGDRHTRVAGFVCYGCRYKKIERCRIQL